VVHIAMILSDVRQIFTFFNESLNYHLSLLPFAFPATGADVNAGHTLFISL